MLYPNDSKLEISETKVIALVGAVQFVNILDFMMVMPLGPDFARDLGIDLGHIGIVGGTYTASAAVAGLAAALVLDRMDRKTALGITMFGLSLGTLAGAFSTNLVTLLLARGLAGIFGGPATSVSLSIIADVVPAERRGRAMSKVMAAFSISSVLGVPAGLELARLGGWRTPFFVVAALSVVVTALAMVLLPPLRLHLLAARGESQVSRMETFRNLLTRLPVLAAYGIVGLSTLSAFSVIPNVSSHIQQNLGYPRDGLGKLYFAGGLVSLVVMQFTGRAVDRLGSLPMTTIGIFGFVLALWTGFIDNAQHLPIIGVFMLFMGMQSMRNIAQTTLISKVPSPQERAGFMSVQSAVQHMASAAGSFLSSLFLVEKAGKLEGIDKISMLAAALAISTLPLFLYLERYLKTRTDAQHPPHPAEAGTHL